MPQDINTRDSRPNLLVPAAISIGFAVLAVIFRMTPRPENFACFGALAFFCGLTLRGPLRWFVPLVAMFAGDFIGHFAGSSTIRFYHTPSMIVNYLAFASMIGVGQLSQRLVAPIARKEFLALGVVGLSAIVGSFVFFLISNFAAWLDPMMGYDNTVGGLINSYIMGIPFWKSTLVSDVTFSLAFYAVSRLILRSVESYRFAHR